MSSGSPLTEEALLVTLAVSIALGTEAAVVAGTTLEVGAGRVESGSGECRGCLTLLVCSRAVLFNQAVQRLDKLRVAADAGEVGCGAARGRDACFCCG